MDEVHGPRNVRVPKRARPLRVLRSQLGEADPKGLGQHGVGEPSQDRLRAGRVGRRDRTEEVMSATEVVQRYHEAFGRGEVQEARSLLADDLYFKGPMRSRCLRVVLHGNDRAREIFVPSSWAGRHNRRMTKLVLVSRRASRCCPVPRSRRRPSTSKAVPSTGSSAQTGQSTPRSRRSSRCSRDTETDRRRCASFVASATPPT